MDEFKTQRHQLFIFLGARMGDWVPLPEILGLGISQYNARIKELRDKGHLIECREQRVGRKRHTWYRLVPHHHQQELPLP